ncbi:MAG TPA: hypothetical protein VFT22_09925 [Kofleriaceae bacterium]|nr:hypothetical protein [Kofleriaceae bacterium]
MAAARHDASQDLVKPVLRLFPIESTAGIGRLGASPFPDRQGELAHQPVALAFHDRIKPIATAVALAIRAA